jgi:hypothetical protein
VIRLQRTRSTAIPARFRGAKRLLHERDLLTARRDFLANPGSKFDFLSNALWKDAKPQLKAESHKKCAIAKLRPA